MGRGKRAAAQSLPHDRPDSTRCAAALQWTDFCSDAAIICDPGRIEAISQLCASQVWCI